MFSVFLSFTIAVAAPHRDSTWLWMFKLLNFWQIFFVYLVLTSCIIISHKFAYAVGLKWLNSKVTLSRKRLSSCSSGLFQQIISKRCHNIKVEIPKSYQAPLRLFVCFYALGNKAFAVLIIDKYMYAYIIF